MKNNQIGERYCDIIEDILQGDIDTKNEALKQFLIETARYNNNI